MTLILASTSPYRRALLARLGLTFEVQAPHVDESALDNEPAQCLALRLAQEKAIAVARANPKAIVIGSDQVAFCGQVRLDKPLTEHKALEQLRLQRGNTSDFHTAVCVASHAGDYTVSEIVSTRVKFLPATVLTDSLLRQYIQKEKPMDCAGAAKSEGLGASLMESIEGPDPTALVGLPLIALCKILRSLGIEPTMGHTGHTDQ